MEERDREWRKRLSDAQYRVLRLKDTEPPFSGRYLYTRQKGTYCCAACGNVLFTSEAKFDSGSGW
ncbi:MAG: peptide-methionine (R)-S-oxide reductase [Syntrophomonadaceae bacterium]|nr:peptide-methionine (R)-S-oxide reductase [Syntrophomonadaceae bacterium]